MELNHQHQPLIFCSLFKASQDEDADAPWKFAGIASDESIDAEGDALLKEILDISYAQQRGYVNWGHSQEPADQVGYLTKASIIDGHEEIAALSKQLNADISASATVYVEGELYKHVPKASDVWNIMRSATSPQMAGIGLSLEGGLRKDKTSGKLLKAVVRGVAITPKPAHPKTLLALRKELSETTDQLEKSAGALSHDEAILFVLRQRPRWTFELAEKVVTLTKQKVQGAAA